VHYTPAATRMFQCRSRSSASFLPRHGKKQNRRAARELAIDSAFEVLDSGIPNRRLAARRKKSPFALPPQSMTSSNHPSWSGWLSAWSRSDRSGDDERMCSEPRLDFSVCGCGTESADEPRSADGGRNGRSKHSISAVGTSVS
jgi:hypothetical protein